MLVARDVPHVSSLARRDEERGARREGCIHRLLGFPERNVPRTREYCEGLPRTQCAAVKAQFSFNSEAPQVCPPEMRRDSCHGHE